MKKKLFVLFLFTKILFAQITLQDKNIILIDPQERGEDIYNAYNTLTTLVQSKSQIFFTLKNGSTIKDIDTVTLLSQKTILYIKTIETSKIKYYFIPVENIESIDYTPL